MGTIFFTSDHHFDHTKMADLRDMEADAMNEMMLDKWNAVVRPNDTVYHLGDFAWRRHHLWFDRLNGHKHLIVGNHDKKECLKLKWVSVDLYKEKSWNSILFVLFHYPILEWNRKYHGSVHLYGHVHTNQEHPDRLAFNVGVDYPPNAYAPVSLDAILLKARRRYEMG